ncbi:hypothetical protein PLESTB_001582200 [Pleodorina starrii]|uniref:Uncharacterized protein n=1 Tax=Pleodorina starrii TaxID=330485 RepID=A0A9W6F8F8_9CHLO|nr:hypothetical protein PLESTM_000722800 [Pleodorina starrii]GLC60178.1 hypothetical protein PLESTB_001582200 [Pleodorina starrii]
MWEQRNSLYAPPADEEKFPLTRRARTPWQRLKSWVRERPLLSALIAIIVVGGIVAVIAGPVASSQRKDREQNNQISVQGIDFRMTFEAQDAAQVCSNFTDANFLSGYAATLRTSIASILSLQLSQVALDSVQCGSKNYYLSSSGNRRLFQIAPADSGVSIVVAFRLLSSGSSSGDSSSSPLSGNSNGSDEKLPQPAAAASQLQSSSLVLQQAVSQALGLPSSNVVLVSVVTGQQGAATAPPPAPPASLSPLPGLPPVPSPPTEVMSPPPVVEHGSPPPLLPNVVVPGIYSSSPPPSPAPVYGLNASPPPPPPPPAYGASN